MASLKILHNYGGALTGETRIIPGVYEADSPELFGLAEYLVQNGHAEWTDAAPDAWVPPAHEALQKAEAEPVSEAEALDSAAETAAASTETSVADTNRAEAEVTLRKTRSRK